MSELNLLNRRDRALAPIAALVMALCVVTVLAFLHDGQTEWFPADSELALAASRCVVVTDSTQRHACLRKIAQTHRANANLPTRIAER